MKVFAIDNVQHEVTFEGPRKRKGGCRITLRCCGAAPIDVRDETDIRYGLTTCLRCIVRTEQLYDTHCKVCHVKTGTTVFEWATDDMCDDCIEYAPLDAPRYKIP